MGEKGRRLPQIALVILNRSGEENFSIVNVSPRRLLSRRGGFESAGRSADRAENACALRATEMKSVCV
jgi:hypothetical protein